MKLITSIQVGKKGLNEGLIETLKSHFKNHQNVKVVFLKSSTREKEKLKNHAGEIIEKLGKKNVIRPVLFPPDKGIGGHCVVPNTEILKKYYKSQAFDLILKFKKNGK